MCNQCVRPVHLGIRGFSILILGSVHRLGLVGAGMDPGGFIRNGTVDRHFVFLLPFSWFITVRGY